MSSSSSSANGAAFDPLTIQSLMSRLQLRPPYLDTNSFLSHSLDDFLLPSDPDDDSDPDPDSEAGAGAGDRESRHRRLIAREEAKLEKEIIKIIATGNGPETLKANTGQSVSIGDHNICVGVHGEEGSEYRVWEWHGHIMFFDDDDGYSAEYIYGNYFERVTDKNRKQNIKKDETVEEEGDEEEEGSRVKGEGNSGLRDLIGGEGDKGLVGGIGARILHRNALNAGSSSSK